jgi:adenylate kinase
MGPPGGGKGTQAQRVLQDAKAVQISTGDELRAAIAAGTAAGKKAQGFMGQGKLVPDEIVNEVLRDRITKPDSKDGWILDGYPRTLGQAKALDSLLADLKQKIEKVVFVDVPFSAIEDRVLNRRSCAKDGSMYNLKFSPPKMPGKCDKCGGDLVQRPDDSAEKLKTRLEAYTKDTVPVIDYYKQKGLLAKVDAGTKKADEVEALVRAALGLAKKK